MAGIEGKLMLEVLGDFVRKTQDCDISCMVTGSFAMSAYGEMRFTRDIEIVIEIIREQIDDFSTLLKKIIISAKMPFDALLKTNQCSI